MFSKKKPFIIAEIGANHNGSEKLIYKLIDEAKKAGANAVKFQSWNKNNIFTKKLYQNKKPDFKPHQNINSQEELIDCLTITDNQFVKISNYCKKKNIIFSSTPFDEHSLNFLNRIGMPFIKVASMDLNHLFFLKKIAKKKKPILLSTGMANMKEIFNALEAIYSVDKNAKIIPLYCVSNYPPKDSEINLGSISYLKKTLNLDIGFSDHSNGIAASLAAISLGARVIEKHFTLDKNMPGWDHKISADPVEMSQIVRIGKKITKFSFNAKQKIINEDEKVPRLNMRRSIVAKNSLKKGFILKKKDIDFKRPGTGLPPDQLDNILGKVLNKNIKKDELINKNYFKK